MKNLITLFKNRPAKMTLDIQCLKCGENYRKIDFNDLKFIDIIREHEK